MRDPENIRAVESLKPDMMGFICWDGSKRYVSSRPIYMPSCTKVGVFVNPTAEHVHTMASTLSLDMIQLHGQESPAFCKEVTATTSLPIIKAFSISTEKDLANTEAYEEVAELFLFDTKCTCVGGSGRQFDWSILEHYKGNTPFLLSGGIGPDDAERLLQWHHPLCIGIDLNSRFEISPALKDTGKLASFIESINKQVNDNKQPSLQ